MVLRAVFEMEFIVGMELHGASAPVPTEVFFQFVHVHAISEAQLNGAVENSVSQHCVYIYVCI